MASHTQPVNTDKEKVDELLTRGVAELIHEDSLREKLLSGKRLRVKLGIDPTSPDLHLGRSVPLLKLRDFQELGHQIVFIVGDFTAVIGDTSDKDSERPMLSRETIEANKRGYFEQVGKIIDIETAELRYNSEWLEKLTYREIGEHADCFSVSDFIARENIKRRLEGGKRVSLREVLYPLMQGYDSVAVEADVELGGTDQKFNLLAGRVLQEKFGQAPQDIMTYPLIEGLDGRKMSSSWGNTVNVTESPSEMYGKIMSLTDALMEKYFVQTTRMPLSEIEALKEGHPRDMKMRLAREVITMYHGADEAARAEAAFTTTFREGGIPEDTNEVSIASGALLGDVLLEHGAVASKTEFRRLVSEGAIAHIESGEKVADHAAPARTGTYKIGKRRFLKITVA